jgi:aspartate racemase
MGKIGFLGGMGEEVSDSFIAKINRAQSKREEGPKPFIYVNACDLPDRTEATYDPTVRHQLVKKLNQYVREIVNSGTSEVFPLCFTVGAFLEELDQDLQPKVTSLLPIATDLIHFSAEQNRKILVLCTEGSRRTRLFERDPRWSTIKDKVIFLRGNDQKLIHSVIYSIKSGGPSKELALITAQIVKRYSDCILLGCTEFHLLAASYPDVFCEAGMKLVDPMAQMAAAVFSLTSHRFVIRPALTLEDRLALFQLREKSYQSANKNLVYQENDPLDADAFNIIALLESKIVGAIRIRYPKVLSGSGFHIASKERWTPRSVDRLAEISRLCVAPEFKGGPIAKCLVRKAIELSLEAGRPEIVLSATRKEAEFYLNHFGMKSSDVFYSNDAFDGLPHEILQGNAVENLSWKTQTEAALLKASTMFEANENFLRSRFSI